ncbi:MAG TPA: hypothetical protein PLI62_15395 [Spirochaetota bacterium]|nr:hypothetical protein [Spirochaetota bacterium]
MLINVEQTRTGFSLRIDGDHWNADPCEFRFPEEVWSAFSCKDELINELAYVTTMATPLMLRHDRVIYNRPEPRFLNLYNESFLKTIPNLVEDIPCESTTEIEQFFRSIRREFKDGARRENSYCPVKKTGREVVIPFSFGKDSLLSLGTLMTLGYEPVPVVIDERVLPRAFSEKQKLIKQLRKATGINCHIVTNEIQLLSDFEILETPATRVYQVQVYFIYLLAMLPFCEYYGADTIILNNEYVNTLAMMHREGALHPYRYMQSREATESLRKMAEEYTDGAVTVANLIGGLGNFSINQMLHETFPGPGKLRLSCHIEIVKYRRWCHECHRCAQSFLFLKALGHNTGDRFFKKNMLEVHNRNYFNAFDTFHHHDKYRAFNGLEERLALAMLQRKADSSPLVRIAAEMFPPISDSGIMTVMKQVFSVQDHRESGTIEEAADNYYKNLMDHFISEAPKRFRIL